MGEVYRARDTRLDRDVAIKILHQAFASDPDRQRRFEQEARAIAALNHPHICQLHDVGPGYLVLEFVDGEPVRGPMRPEEAVRLALQIASALEAAHRHGILHRDLKPANILVTRTGGPSDSPTIKLLDFGLAKMMTPAGRAEHVTLTMPGTIIGTPAYMSPEQVEAKPLDARSDVFSFGAVLYEMLSGSRAFGRDTVGQVVSAILRENPPALKAPAALVRIVQRCIAKEPLQRFQTMQEVRTALERAIAQAPPDVQPSIAVLPFENMSGDKENEYFSDGLAEEIITALTRIPELKVIARTSAFAFKGKHEDVRRIAEALGVTNVLEGSVRKAAGRMRVTAQLITANDGSHLWSERFDRAVSDVFAVQDEIATAIANALKVTLSSPSAHMQRYKPKLPAYEHYLRALYDAQQVTPETMASAHVHFERAIELDPQFALAHAEFGHYLHRLVLYGLTVPREAMVCLRTEARRALDLDASLPEGHALLGLVASMYDFDWPEAERRFRLALTNEPVPPHVHRYYAHYCLLPLGRFEEALHHQALGVRGDPMNLVARAERAACLLAAGREQECNEELQRLLELDRTFWFPYFLLGRGKALHGPYEEAVHLAEQAYVLAPWFKPNVGFLAAMLKRTGDTARAETLTRELWPEQGYSDPVGPALYHLLTGDLDAAFDWTRKAIEERQPSVMFFLSVHGNALRSDPRWRDLARMMNLTPS
jgi:serine/threonine-protein kinase